MDWNAIVNTALGVAASIALGYVTYKTARATSKSNEKTSTVQAAVEEKRVGVEAVKVDADIDRQKVEEWIRLLESQRAAMERMDERLLDQDHKIADQNRRIDQIEEENRRLLIERSGMLRDRAILEQRLRDAYGYISTLIAWASPHVTPEHPLPPQPPGLEAPA